MASAFFFGSLVIFFLSGWGGWRFPFLGFVLPVSVLGLVMVLNGVPTKNRSVHLPSTTKMYKEGFKQILKNRSATACLVGTALIFAGWQAILIFNPYFFQQRYHVSEGASAIFYIGITLSYILGTIVISRYINKYGRKPLTVITAALAGICIIFYMNVSQSEIILLSNPLPNFLPALILCGLGSLFFGMLVTSSTSLTLEHLSQFRGTMMSTHVAVWALGAALGTFIGGRLLVEYETNIVIGYRLLGQTLGVMILIGALVFYFLARDPTKGAESYH